MKFQKISSIFVKMKIYFITTAQKNFRDDYESSFIYPNEKESKLGVWFIQFLYLI